MRSLKSFFSLMVLILLSFLLVLSYDTIQNLLPERVEALLGEEELCAPSFQVPESDTGKEMPFIAPEQFEDIGFEIRFEGKARSALVPFASSDGSYILFIPGTCSFSQVHVSTLNGIKLTAAGTGNTLLLKNNCTLTGISIGTEYLLYFKSSENEIRNVKVRFLSGSEIAAVFIRTDGGLIPDRTSEQTGKLILIDSSGKVGFEGNLQQIKGRGNSTLETVKIPLSLKLRDSSDILGMGYSDNWCLLSNNMDSSCLRNAIAFDAAKAAGLQYTPDYEYADVWINGEYLGLYLLTD